MTQPQHLSSERFQSFTLHPKLLQAVADLGFEYCTPIQARALPLALAGQDVAGQAQTGTGKTIAFLLASMHRLLTRTPDPRRKLTQPRMLVLAPTRELAIQVHKDAVQLGQHTDLKLGLAFGGTDYEKQRAQLAAGCDILIGTPGRIIDYFKQHVFDLKMIEVVVLDEADRMFDLGFISDIRFLLRKMPPAGQRLNMLFSATLSYRVLELAYEHMNNPQMVKIETDKVTVDRVRQALYHVSNEEKIPLLLGLLHRLNPPRALVFINTKRMGDILEQKLIRRGWNAAVMSGDVPQKKRLRLLREFHDGKLPILVATDVAARGLHIPDVTHVFNFDLPQDAEDYVHRIGRTARAGAYGDAISLCCETYVYSLPEIEKFIGHKIPSATITPELLHAPPRPRPETTSATAQSAEEERVPKPHKHGKAGSKHEGRSHRRRRRGPPSPTPAA